MATFSSYPSITNRVDRIVDVAADVSHEGSENPTGTPPGEWLVTHKIHGTNMSAIIDAATGGVEYARRNGRLGTDRSFYGYGTVLPPLFDTAGPAILAALRSPCERQVVVYGELYGDGIQREIKYCAPGTPSKRFSAFDVCVDGVFLDYADACRVLDAAGIPRVPVVVTGSFEAMLAWAKEHCADVPLPGWLSTAPVDGDVVTDAGEGWVLRPSVETVNRFGDRTMLKVKNPRFGESQDDVHGRPEGHVVDSSAVEEDAPTTTARAYITPARVANVLAKEHPDTLVMHNIPMFITRVVDDAKRDLRDGETMNPKKAREIAALHIRSNLRERALQLPAAT